MNILFYYQLNIIPEMGGTERATYAVARELESRGFHCIFLAHRAHVNNDIFNSDISQFYLPNSDVLECTENEKYTHSLIDQEHIDILINQDAMEYASSLFFTKHRFPEVRIVGTFHFSLSKGKHDVVDSFKQRHILGKSSLFKYIIQRIFAPYYRHKNKKRARQNYRRTYTQVDRIVLLSKHEIGNFPCADTSRIAIIPNPLTIQRKNYHTDKEKLILIVSRLTYVEKRLDFFLKAWDKIEKKHPDWKVNILGDGSCKNYYCGLAKKFNLRNVTFCGRTSPDKYYARASIICSTSTSEGFGLSLTEGMMYGCVPISFDSFPTVHDIIDHMKNGILVPSFDIDLYASELKRLISNNTLRIALSKRAAETVSRFDPHTIGDKWCKLLYDLT